MPRRTGWYNLSTHFPWIGDRTRALDGAHVEYFRGIANPIGVKIGPAVTPDEVLALAERAQPAERAGPADVHSPLRRGPRGEVPAAAGRSDPPQAAKQVLWCCDPMHGNTETTRERHQDPPLREHPGRAGDYPAASSKTAAPTSAACISS